MATLRGSAPSTTRPWTLRASLKALYEEVFDGNLGPKFGWTILAAPPTTYAEFAAADHKGGPQGFYFMGQGSIAIRYPAGGDPTFQFSVSQTGFDLVDPAWMAGKHFYIVAFKSAAAGSDPPIATYQADPA